MKAKPFVIALLAAMACLVVASIYIAATVDRAERTISTVVSPDGKFKAVRLTVSGERPAPYCVDTIAIFLSAYPDTFVASETNYEVYAAPCAPPGKRAALPKIEWLSDKAVRITYLAGSDKTKTRMKNKDASLFVQVTFASQ